MGVVDWFHLKPSRKCFVSLSVKTRAVVVYETHITVGKNDRYFEDFNNVGYN